MYPSTASSIPVCTVRCHPTGGYTPVLHLSAAAPPEPTSSSISLPTTAEAAQYARNHYGVVDVRIAKECDAPPRVA